jgi:hypothetical protein
MKTIETGFGRLTLDDDGIMTARPVEVETPRTAEMVAEIMTGMSELAGSTPRPILYFPGNTSLQPRGWQMLIDRIEASAVAIAIVAADAARRRLGAFPAMVDSLMLPVRIFTEESDGRDWLATFVAPLPED